MDEVAPPTAGAIHKQSLVVEAREADGSIVRRRILVHHRVRLENFVGRICYICLEVHGGTRSREFTWWVGVS